MDTAHLHLVLNHFPIIGALLGSVLLAYGYFVRSEQVQRASLGVLFFMALIAIPVFLTGEPAEERVEGLPGVSEALIEQHEETAELALWVMEAMGFFALIALILGFRRHPLFKTLTAGVLVLSIVSFALMARTGYLGGQIRHSEIRSGATVGAPIESSSEQDDD